MKGTKLCLILGALTLAFGILTGAFGAHILQSAIEDFRNDIYQTANKYLFLHGLALLIIGLLKLHFPRIPTARICTLMLIGVACFSLSLYFLSAKSVLHPLIVTILGPITPIGGMLLTLSWLYLAYVLWRTSDQDGHADRSR